MVTVPGTQVISERWSYNAGDQRPLEARWREVARQVEALGHSPIVPVTEEAVWQMRKLVERRARPAVPEDPARIAASRAHSDLLNRYAAAVIEVDKLQRRVPAVVDDPVHQLLNDIPAGWNADLPKMLADPLDWQSTRAEIERESARIGPLVVQAEALQEQLSMALSVNERDPEVLLPQLVHALIGRLGEIENLMAKNRQLHAQAASTLSERIDDLEGQLARLGQAVRKRK
jgi:hypothetical protein